MVNKCKIKKASKKDAFFLCYDLNGDKDEIQ